MAIVRARDLQQTGTEKNVPIVRVRKALLLRNTRKHPSRRSGLYRGT